MCKGEFDGAATSDYCKFCRDDRRKEKSSEWSKKNREKINEYARRKTAEKKNQI